MMIWVLMLGLVVPWRLRVAADTTATHNNNTATVMPDRIISENNMMTNGTLTPPLLEDTPSSIMTNATNSSDIGDFGSSELGDNTTGVTGSSNTCDASKYHRTPEGACKLCPRHCPKDCDESSDVYRVFTSSDCDGLATSSNGGAGGLDGGTTSTLPILCDTTVYHLNRQGICTLCPPSCPRECDPSSESYVVYGSAGCWYNDMLPLPNSMNTNTGSDDTAHSDSVSIDPAGQEQNGDASSATLHDLMGILATFSALFMLSVVHRF